MPNNIPGTYTEIQMSGNSKIQQSAPGYIGLDLRDDHPVAIKHDQGKDPELVTPPVGGGVRLYNATAAVQNVNGSYVECTSCHNPHDNTYGKFLVEPNQYSALCLRCHTKTGYSSGTPGESAHYNAKNSLTQAYAPLTGGTPNTLGTTVGDVQCMVCHFPHKAGVLDTNPTNPNAGSGKYLLTYQEEQSCYNKNNRWGQNTNVCHGDNAGATKNIQSEVTKGSAHRVGNYSGLHNATEGRSVSAAGGWLGVAGNGWHVECDDCHNAHTAGRLTHTPPGNAVDSTLAIYGAGGAEPPASFTAWSAPSANTYTYIEPIGVLRTSGANLGVTTEYQICLKCHSSFAWGTGSAPTSPSLGSPMTDQAQEFNQANDSFHPVMGVNNKNNLGTFKPGSGWNNGTQTMYCSDCHGNNSASPNGPHGSINRFLLTTPFVDTYPTSTSIAQNQPSSGDLCWNCHDVDTYLTGADNYNPSGTGFSTGGGTVTNLHTRHKTLAASSALSLYAYRCVNCHSRVPHGYGDGATRASRAMIVKQNAGFPYEATAGGGKISSVTFPIQRIYTTRDAQCSTVAGCHHNP
jgi:predicted CXXCH cytochrome family protein